MKALFSALAFAVLLASCSSDAPASDVNTAELPRSASVTGSDASSAVQAAKTSVSPEKASDSADCIIKGNVSAKGEKIYHVPGGGYYDRTEVDESAGERWFCTEVEARAAGWRKSKR